MKDLSPPQGPHREGCLRMTWHGMAEKVLQANPDVVDEILSGQGYEGEKTKFLLGLVMKEARGQAAADTAARILGETS